MSELPLSFENLGLSAPVVQLLAEIGYETPSPIQAATIPPLLAGRDLLGTAQTGTGKTAAFALPLLHNIDVNLKAPQCLVLAPTRELAIQVAEAFQTYARHLPGFHVLPIYGGQAMGTQLHQLKRGPHVVVGTPGRVMDHLRRGSLNLSSLQSMVLDEADEMLKMGFIDDVEWILEHTPPERQVALFSATMPAVIQKVTKKYLNDPVEVKIKSSTTTVAAIAQSYWRVSGTHKLDALTRILEVEEFDGVIIFVRTKNSTVELAEKLEARGHSCAALNGDITQEMRERTVNSLKQGRLDIIVATDVAARGLDVPRISHVINYDIPHDAEAYTHRIGRTGRAGREGKAILFVAPREMRMLQTIERTTRQPIAHMELPSTELITNKRVTQFKERITAALESQEIDFFEELIANYQEEFDFSYERIAAALAMMAQEDKPLRMKKPLPGRDPRDTGPKERPAGRERGERTREDRPDRARAPRRDRPDDTDKTTYRLEVGREHGVTPGDIVGAIANEADIESRNIGRIQIHDNYSTVDLPEGLPKEMLSHLRQVRVRQMPLQIAPLMQGGAVAPRPTGNEAEGSSRRTPYSGGDDGKQTLKVKKGRTDKDKGKPKRRITPQG